MGNLPISSTTIRFVGLPALLLLALSLLLTACDTSAVGIGQKAATPTFQEVDGTPKGPGSANLTATARATPIVTVCPTFSVAPASTTGWKLYRDTRFPFQFAIPPGWKAGSFNGSSADGSDTYYEVAVLPDASTFPFEHASGAPEEFEISIGLTTPPFNPSSDPTWIAERTPITISGTKANLYDRTSPDCGEYDRTTVAEFGQHQFTFYTGIYAPGKAQQDISLFLGILRSFKYTG
ncbi:MAG TPA: hypothetical protein VFA09_27820 [Ktedonobacteraceae bacterium]|nr:hypothetical protein [Ktedonobacteraceae bacterium]